MIWGIVSQKRFWSDWKSWLREASPSLAPTMFRPSRFTIAVSWYRCCISFKWRSKAGAEASVPRANLTLCDPTWTPGCSQNNGTEPRVCRKDETSPWSPYMSCSVSTKLATWPSSLTPRTLNRVPARSQLSREKIAALNWRWPAYTVRISTLPHVIRSNQREQSIP